MEYQNLQLVPLIPALRHGFRISRLFSKVAFGWEDLSKGFQIRKTFLD